MTGALTYPDAIARHVLFAVELLDPVTGDLVSTPAAVVTDGLANGPVSNLSGRFVFLAQSGTPGTVRVDLHGLPYEAVTSPPPDTAGGQTLLRLTLQPTSAYPFADSATLLRGRLVDGTAPVAGAAIAVTFADSSANDAALPARTDGLGYFAVLLRLDPGSMASSDPVTADLSLSFIRNGATRTRAGLRVQAAGKSAIDIATKKPIAQFDWSAL
jgi:hypothetical protein